MPRETLAQVWAAGYRRGVIDGETGNYAFDPPQNPYEKEPSVIFYMARCADCVLDIPFTSRLSRMRWTAGHRKDHPDHEVVPHIEAKVLGR
jgi:hypothetical protein